MKKFVFAMVAVVMMAGVPAAALAEGPVKSKFYDFSDQLIDGDIKKPTTLFTDARAKVKFDRLLRLKKSFIEPMLDTAKEDTFK
ncbi:MAG TPA: hypothetical protein PLY68_02655 [Myxococcota bacterium]|nr:hypothetical protein [Myxococcota bacterium]HNZ03314.1 hypothetical protein [Myxococcota bacterium]HOD07741.1 hypothetical protein [Myxococcota bacterium]HPB50612.1 hypothetical protein [Myxococcota bacterium]HQP95078.1 hypothetical protein [Myxococcota bacterium]